MENDWKLRIQIVFGSTWSLKLHGLCVHVSFVSKFKNINVSYHHYCSRQIVVLSIFSLSSVFLNNNIKSYSVGILVQSLIINISVIILYKHPSGVALTHSENHYNWLAALLHSRFTSSRVRSVFVYLFKWDFKAKTAVLSADASIRFHE